MRERVALGAFVVTCGGRSMEPAVRLGTRIRVSPGAARPGAVAAFVTRSGDLELHRLIARGPRGWWVQAGDNQTTSAVGLVHEAQLVGLADVPSRRPSLRSLARAAARIAIASACTLSRGPR